jgi:hypothetical protein
MMTDEPIKCASKDFKAAPFYLIQSNGTEKRLVASFQDKEVIKTFLLTFINKADKELQIKIRDFDDHENPIDFDGTITKQN